MATPPNYPPAAGPEGDFFILDDGQEPVPPIDQTPLPPTNYAIAPWLNPELPLEERIAGAERALEEPKKPGV